MKHKTMIYQRKVFKIIKYPGENNGIYLIGRKQDTGHLITAEIPENKVIEKPYLKALT